MTRSLLVGLGAAGREWRLVLWLWLWNVVLAGVAVAPVAVWWQGALGRATETSVLASGLDIPLLIDMLETSGAAAVVSLVFTVAVLALAAVASVFVTGGVVETLVTNTPPDRVSLARLLQGAGRMFWRNLRLVLLSLVVAGLLGGAVFAGLRAATKPLQDSLSEVGAWTRALGPLAAAGVILLVFSLVLDFGRVGLAAADERRARRAWWRGARFVTHHLLATVGLWLVVVCLAAVGLAAYLGIRNVLPAASWPLVVVMILAQQVFVVWRAVLRVTLVAGQVDQARRLGLPGVEGAQGAWGAWGVR